MTRTLKKIILLSFIAISAPTLHAAPPPSVYSTTFSILAYAKWRLDTPKLCVVDNTSVAQHFKNYASAHHKYDTHAIQTHAIKQNDCQILIFSTLSAIEEQQILNHQVDFPALSISLNNVDCETGSAFCLYKKNQNYAFKVNLESLTQSKLHIDPRVLLLAKPTEPNS